MANYPCAPDDVGLDILHDLIALAVLDWRRGPGVGLSDKALKQTHDFHTAEMFLESLGQLERVREIHGEPGSGLPKTDRGRTRAAPVIGEDILVLEQLLLFDFDVPEMEVAA